MVRAMTENKVSFVETATDAVVISNAGDAVDVLSTCGSSRTDRLLIHDGAIDSSFFDLKSGLAGEILQKFSTYRMTVAIVLSPGRADHPRFSEMIYESNSSARTAGQVASPGSICYFASRETAVSWLCGAAE